MKRSDKWTSMVVFLERDQHKDLRDMCLASGTFPHRVMVEMVRHLNEKGLPIWLVKACLKGHQQTVNKRKKPKVI